MRRSDKARIRILYCPYAASHACARSATHSLTFRVSVSGLPRDFSRSRTFFRARSHSVCLDGILHFYDAACDHVLVGGRPQMRHESATASRAVRRSGTEPAVVTPKVCSSFSRRGIAAVGMVDAADIKKGDERFELVHALDAELAQLVVVHAVAFDVVACVRSCEAVAGSPSIHSLRVCEL